MFSKILVPLDGSRYAEKALRYALDIAKKYEAKITLIHVIPKHYYSKELEEEGKHILHRGQEIANSVGISVETTITKGIPAEEIIHLANDQRSDLIVIGNRGLSRARSFFLGSVSYKISLHAKCPTLIIR